MSAQLDAFLDKTRVQQMLANDEAMGIVPQKLRKFLVQIGPKDAPRITLDVLARSSTEAFMQHADLASVGERVVVLAEGVRG